MVCHFLFAFVWLVRVTGLCCQHSCYSSGCFCFIWEFSLWWFLTPCLSTLFIVFCTSSVYVSQNNNKIWFDVINVLFFLSAQLIACAWYHVWSELITVRNSWTTCVSDRLPIRCHMCSVVSMATGIFSHCCRDPTVSIETMQVSSM